MYISKYKDTSFNDIISRFIPDDILDLNPIIAGGFPLSIYRSLKIYDGNMRPLLMRDLDRRAEPFGDIDLWFLSSSDIHNEKSHFNSLINSSLRMGQLAPYKSFKRRTKDSKFAVTYQADMKIHSKARVAFKGNRVVQIIKEPQESVSSLLPKFDYVNCAIAWHDGSVYSANDLDDCFDYFELRHNPLYESGDNESMATMMFRSLRAFKYADRYSLDFDRDIAKYIFKTYFKIKNVKPASEHRTGRRSASITLGPYGAQEVQNTAILNMAMNLHRRFTDFVQMESFRHDYILYLIDSTFLPIKDALACLGLDEFRSTDCKTINGIPF
jgi:hypothetical protein